jgi:hypothetical protein
MIAFSSSFLLLVARTILLEAGWSKRERLIRLLSSLQCVPSADTLR